jgi:hypothetical protein
MPRRNGSKSEQQHKKKNYYNNGTQHTHTSEHTLGRLDYNNNNDNICISHTRQRHTHTEEEREDERIVHLYIKYIDGDPDTSPLHTLNK